MKTMETPPPTDEQVLAGQAVHTRRTLAVYDVVVLGISNRVVWKCPTPRLLAHYDRHVSANHLDVGAGTNDLRHCLPGPIGSKAVVFDQLRAVMKSDAVLFGATLLSGGVGRSRAARRLVALHNRGGITATKATISRAWSVHCVNASATSRSKWSVARRRSRLASDGDGCARESMNINC